MTRLLLLAMCVLCACDDVTARAVDPAADAGTEQPADAASLAPQQRIAADAGTDEPDSAAEPLADASAPDAGAVADAGPADAGRAVPVVTQRQLDQVVGPLCGACHTPWATGGQKQALPTLVLSGEVALYSDNVSTCDEVPYIVPGHPEQSYLVTALTVESPCEQHAAVAGLTSEKLQLLRDWISGLKVAQ